MLTHAGHVPLHRVPAARAVPHNPATPRNHGAFPWVQLHTFDLHGGRPVPLRASHLYHFIWVEGSLFLVKDKPGVPLGLLAFLCTNKREGVSMARCARGWSGGSPSLSQRGEGWSSRTPYRAACPHHTPGKGLRTRRAPHCFPQASQERPGGLGAPGTGGTREGLILCTEPARRLMDQHLTLVPCPSLMEDDST